MIKDDISVRSLDKRIVPTLNGSDFDHLTDKTFVYGGECNKNSIYALGHFFKVYIDRCQEISVHIKVTVAYK